MNSSILYDKIRGSYYGAAIADAMGGPVETMNYRKIDRLYGRVDTLLEYKSPPGHIKPSPNVYYVSQTIPGTYTDDTRGRNMIVDCLIQKGGRISADEFAEYLLENLNPEAWWPAVMVSYWLIKFGGVAPRDAGQANMPGGGLAWWSPFGIINAGKPEQAYWDAFEVCSILKRGTDRELSAAMTAAVAAGFEPEATVDSVVNASIQFVGPESRSRILDAVRLARESSTPEMFFRRAYQELLVDWKARYQLTAYTPIEGEFSCDLEEQVPIALACFVLADGNAGETIMNAVNFGRDSDTIATAAGAIAGAYDGTKNIPSEWIETCANANPDPTMEFHGRKLEFFCEGLYALVKRAVARSAEIVSEVGGE